MKNNEDKKILLACTAFSILLVLPIFLYALHMGGGLSDKNEDWGDFCSFIGGVYGSFFSSLSLIIVIWAALESKKSSNEQVNILKNDQHFSQFNLLLTHLKDNFITSFYDSQNQLMDISRHYDWLKINLSVNVTWSYDNKISLIENIKNNASTSYIEDNSYIFDKEAKLFKCILELIDMTPKNIGDAFKVIFESTFDDKQRLSLELYTRARHPEVEHTLNEWPTLSKIPEQCIKDAQENLRANNIPE